MSIKRTRLDFEDHFTQVPNRWVRDGRVSLKARGLLAQLLSHRAGWRVSVASLAAANPEGRDAIRSALTELLEHGYLIRSGDQEHREDGTFGSYEYELADPWSDQPQSENPSTVSPAETPRKRRSAPSSGYPTSDNPHRKKTIHTEDHERTPSPPEGGGEQGELLTPEPPKRTAYPDAFEQLWAAWPKRRTDSAGKKAAHTAWARATRRTAKRPARVTPAAMLAAVEAYAADPNLPPEQYMPNLTTWINGDRWENGPLPARSEGRPDPRPNAMSQGMDTVARLRAQREARQQQQTTPQLEERTA